MGNELIGMLDQVFKLYYQIYGYDLGNNYIGRDYKYLQKLLEFPLDDENSIQMASDSSSGVSHSTEEN